MINERWNPNMESEENYTKNIMKRVLEKLHNDITPHIPVSNLRYHAINVYIIVSFILASNELSVLIHALSLNCRPQILLTYIPFP